MISSLIQKSLEHITELRQRRSSPNMPFTSPPTSFEHGIPTLKEGYYRPVTPMLLERYELLGRWNTATHGHWLSIYDMEELWKNTDKDEFIYRIKLNQIASAENWQNDAAGLFHADRLSLFAGHDNGFERVYLVWFDETDEPEVWAYDSNGESRYINLASYLEAYLSSDISASDKRWILEQALNA